jgi:hypothetical protein
MVQDQDSESFVILFQEAISRILNAMCDTLP